MQQRSSESGPVPARVLSVPQSSLAPPSAMSTPFFPTYSQPFAVPMNPFMQPTFGMYPQPMFPSMYSPFVGMSGPAMMGVNMFSATPSLPSMVPSSLRPVAPCAPTQPPAHPRLFQPAAVSAPAQPTIKTEVTSSRRLPTVSALSVLQHDQDKDQSSDNGDALSPSHSIIRKPTLAVDSSAALLPSLETMTPSASSAFSHVKPESPSATKGKRSRDNSPQPEIMPPSTAVQSVGISLPIKTESPRFYQLSPSASICSDRTAESSTSSTADGASADHAALPYTDDMNQMPLKRICIASRRPAVDLPQMPAAASEDEADADTARALLDLIHGSAAPSDTDSAAAESKEVVKIIYLEPARRKPRKLPMKCTYAGCPYEFNKTSSLKRHLRSHSGEKPFECTIPGCGMRFSEKGNMLRHRDVHFKEKRFQCKVDGCTHNFTRKAHLITHCLARHGVTLK